VGLFIVDTSLKLCEFLTETTFWYRNGDATRKTAEHADA
jgi:hypothetical protein